MYDPSIYLLYEDIIPKIAEMSNLDQFPQIQLEAVSILSEIIGIFTQKVFQNNGIEIFLRIVKSKNNVCITQGLKRLSRICDKYPKYRDKIVTLGIIAAINQNLKNSKKWKIHLKIGIQAISNICLRREALPFQDVRQSIQILISILIYTDVLDNNSYNLIIHSLTLCSSQPEICQNLMKGDGMSILLMRLKSLKNIFSILMLIQVLILKQPFFFAFIISKEGQFYIHVRNYQNLHLKNKEYQKLSNPQFLEVNQIYVCFFVNNDL